MDIQTKLKQIEAEFDEKYPELWSSNDGREGYDSEISQTVKSFYTSQMKSLLKEYLEWAEVIKNEIKIIFNEAEEREDRVEIDDVIKLLTPKE
jgi:hypothetical protein